MGPYHALFEKIRVQCCFMLLLSTDPFPKAGFSTLKCCRLVSPFAKIKSKTAEMCHKGDGLVSQWRTKEAAAAAASRETRAFSRKPIGQFPYYPGL
jgi:hypothetical protein